MNVLSKIMNKMIKHKAVKFVMQFIAGLLVLLGVSQPAWSAYASIKVSEAPPKYGLYYETFEDMSVKVMGGEIRVVRTREDKQWYINKRWTPILEVYPSVRVSGSQSYLSSSSGGSSGGSVAIKAPAPSDAEQPPGAPKLSRNGSIYEWVSGNTYVHTKKPQLTITKTATGWQWRNRKGDWIDYDDKRRVVAYGDRNNVKVTLQYDATNETNITGVFDHFGTQILWYEYNVDGLLSAIRDYTNRKVQYNYTNGQLTEVIDVRGYSWNYEYTNAYLSKKIEPEGRIITISGGQLVSSVLDQDGVGEYRKYEFNKTTYEFYKQIKTSGGKVEEYWFNKDAELIRHDINGVTVNTYQYSGNNKTIIDINGQKTYEIYDQFDNLLSRTHPDGSKVSYVYDTKFSNVTRKTDENGVVTNYEYNANGDLIRVTEAVGKAEERVTEFTNDIYGNITTVKRLADANTALAETILTYDNYGNIASIKNPELNLIQLTVHDVMGNVKTGIDARNKTWQYTYDNAGNLLTKTNPLTYVTEYIYDKTGFLSKITDEKNRATVYVYNTQHRLVKVTNPDLSYYEYAYNPDGQVTQFTDEAGKITRYSYDLAGRLLSITDGNGNVTKQVFDDSGAAGSGTFWDASKFIYPTYEQHIKYDNRNRAYLHTDVYGQSGKVYRKGFDAVGNIIRNTDPEGKTTYIDYDAFANVVKYTDTFNLVTETLYDDRDNSIQITDAKKQIHKFEYDKANGLVKEIRPLGQTLRFEYDGNHNLVAGFDANGQKTEYIFDDDNRQVITKHYATGDHVNPVQITEFNYDEVDNQTGWSITLDAATDRILSGTRSYDALDRPTGETINYGGFSKSYSYDYYFNGSVKAVTGPDAVRYDYVYDNNNNLQTIKIPGQGNIVHNSFKWYQPDKITLPGGTTREYVFNGLLNPTTIQIKDPAKNLKAGIQNIYNNKQDIIEKTTNAGTHKYKYDDAYRLAEVEKDTVVEETYTLDEVGNRLAAKGSTTNWEYNANNQLQSRDNVTYTYDANGNQTQTSEAGVTKKYFYDVANRLLRVEDGTGGVLARYAYDPYDQRLWKEVGGVKTYYLYSEEGLIAEMDATGNQNRGYAYVPGSYWSTDPLFLKQNGQYYYYHNDVQYSGTPQQLTDTTGKIVWSASYNAFGKAIVDPSSSIDNPLRFAGQFYDDETDLHYNWRRYYDPATGRYITPDPIGYEAGMNLYTYVEGDPINYIDSTGECLLPGAAKGAATSIALQYVFCGSVSWKNVAIDAAFGAACLPGKPRIKKPKRPKPCNSFAEDTLVHTRDGLKAIKDINVGDKVLSYAEWLDEKSYQKVTDVIVGEHISDNYLITLSNGETFESTDGHPFFIVGEGWRDAHLLKKGDKLRLQENQVVEIESIRQEQKHNTVYNLSVANTHTFYIGTGGVLVHNARKDCHKGKTTDDPLEPDPKKPTQADPHQPHPDAEGPHTVVGTRTDPKKSPEPYKQGITYDKDGNPLYRTDVSSHGRGDHTNPHRHRYDPNKHNKHDPGNPGNFGPPENM